MSTLLDLLVADGRRAGRLTHARELPRRDGRTASWPQWAHPALIAGYRALGVEEPWQHQVEAADSAWAGRHTVLSTSTGSGKSLAFWLPALTAAYADRAGQQDRTALGRIETVARRGTVLYLCPTKALAADQLNALDRLLTAAEISDLRAVTCDGDTSREERRWATEHADVVLTNPDFLHFALLPQHRRWTRLLGSLRYVILDECHAFRGLFGAHVSAVLRRLRRLATHYGADPVFLLASATTADPAVSASRLIGVAPDQVHSVADDASPTGRKTIALWQPPELPRPSGGTRESGESERVVMSGASAPWSALLPEDDPWALPLDAAPIDATPTDTTPADATPQDDARPRRSATAEVAELLASLTAAGARSLAFTRSRRAAESVATVTQARLRPAHPELAAAVAAYRGGYLPEERRELEDAIRTGRLRALATTNALELGVDISGLDAVVIAGWPGTRVSLWQQAGRAGRAGADGLVILVAREDPLDTYLIRHPEAVLDAPVEATVFDPSNPYILAPHLCAAAAEIPLRAEELDLFGPHTRDLLDVLVTQGALRRRTSGWYWTHTEQASRLTDLRGTGGDPVRVVEATTGRLLGTVDAGSADATVHEGAVYVHQGESYVVAELNLADGVALADHREVDYGTWARWLTTIDICQTVAEHRWGPITWGFGVVDVTSQVISYQRKRLPDLQVLGTETLELPAQTLRTTAVWWTAPSEVLEQAGITQELAPGALHAAEHASIGLLPLLATCDRWDLGGVSTAAHADTEQATVFVHDAYSGGAGFAERGFQLGVTWLRATRDAIADCSCRSGCPACVQSPKCGNGNSPLEKDAAVRLLTAVLSHT